MKCSILLENVNLYKYTTRTMTFDRYDAVTTAAAVV